MLSIKKTIKITHESIAIFFLLFPFLMPEILTTYDFLNAFLNLWKCISFVFIIIFMVIRRDVLDDGKLIVLLFIFLELFLVTLVQKNVNFTSLISRVINSIHIPLMICVFRKKHLVTIARIIFLVTSITTIINLLTQFIFPNGIYLGGAVGRTEMYVLGMENRFVFTYITMIAFGCFLVSLNELKLLSFCIMLGLSAFSLFYAWSVGAMIGILVFILFFYLGIARKNIINYFTGTIIITGLFLFIVVIRGQDMFAYWIEDVFHKSLTFTGRTRLWDLSYKLIGNHLLFGSGLSTANNLFLGVSHPHNEVLYILFHGGIVSLLLHGVFIYLCLHRHKMCTDRRLDIWFSGIYFSLAVMLLVDSWTSTPFFYALFMLIGSFNKIVEEKKTQTLSNAIKARAGNLHSAHRKTIPVLGGK